MLWHVLERPSIFEAIRSFTWGPKGVIKEHLGDVMEEEDVDQRADDTWFEPV